MSYLQLYYKFSSLPAELKKEVADFIDFLQVKTKKKSDIKKRKGGLAKGLVKMTADFDKSIADFKEYM